MRVLAAAAAGLVLLVALPAFGDADPAARLKEKWAEAGDAERAVLLEEATRMPSPVAVDAVAEAARASSDVAKEAQDLRRKMERWLEEEKANAKDGKPPGFAPRDQETMASLLSNVERETRALALLAATEGRLLDALPDGDFRSRAEDLFARGAKDARTAFREWVGEAVGRAKKERTAALCVASAAEALAEYRKNAAKREGPVRDLEKVNAKIADLVIPYLKKQQEKGDYSAGVPEGLLGTLPQQRSALEREVKKYQDPMDSADARRRIARAALARTIAEQDDAGRARQLDVLEKRLLADADPEVKAFGIGALGPVPGERALALLRAAAVSPDPRVVVAAFDAMGERTEPATVDLLSKGLLDARGQVRAAAAAALARTGRALAVPPLIDALKGATGRFLDDLREALAALTGRGFPAAEPTWRAWWEKEGATFLGPRDPRPPGRPAGGEGVATREGEEQGGTSFYGITTHSVRVLFVLDFSGSMNFAGAERDGSKKKIDVLKTEVRRAVTGLPDGATFGIVGFSHDVRVWKKDPVARNAKTGADAIQWVEKQDVVGATNIYDALETAFKLAAPKDKPEPVFDTIFFMTDGTPTAGKVTVPDSIRAEVRRWNESKRVRIHVVGMGGHERGRKGATAAQTDDIDEAFLKSLAADNGGQCVIH